MVARDDDGDAVPVPAWEPVSQEDKALWQHARDLLEIRGRAPGNRLPTTCWPRAAKTEAGRRGGPAAPLSIAARDAHH